MNTKITFKKLEKQDMPLFLEWAKKPWVRDTWFQEGYEAIDKYQEKTQGNGYDYGFIIYLNEKPIGYIQTSDLYSFRIKCPKPTGLFTNEKPGTFCLDVFIGEEEYLNKGYGTEIVKAFVQKLLDDYKAKKILIDPACSNKRAIRCYEKAGFKIIRKANDGVTECCVMEFQDERHAILSNAEFVFIRHAEAEKEGKDISRKLTDFGKNQARECGRILASELPFDIVITSSAIRTKETAYEILKELDQTPHIIEIPSLYLPLEKSTKEQVLEMLKNLKNKPLKNYLENDQENAWSQYVQKAFLEIVEVLKKYQPRRVLVIGHGNIINSLGLLLRPDAKELLEVYFGYCEGYQFLKNGIFLINHLSRIET